MDDQLNFDAITSESGASQAASVSPRALAVVVTHNRLELLGECVERLRAQLVRPDILIVDNASTDGSREWIASQSDVMYIFQTNQGGAGGFYSGLRCAFVLGYDYAWCMDDDTFAERDALARLLVAAEDYDRSQNAAVPLGWICSTVKWIDGSAAAQNGAAVFEPADWAPDGLSDVLPARSCSFVSVCVSRSAIKSVGLPLRQMFIWLDDIEYTRRITDHGFRGLLSKSSVVIHRTNTNEPRVAAGIAPETKWKYRFAYRNTAILMRSKSRGNRLNFVLRMIEALIGTTVSLIRARKLRWIPFAWFWLVRGMALRLQPDMPPFCRSRATVDSRGSTNEP